MAASVLSSSSLVSMWNPLLNRITSMKPEIAGISSANILDYNVFKVTDFIKIFVISEMKTFEGIQD